MNREAIRATCYFCENAWGACTCTFPNGAEARARAGFDFGDVWVTDPSVSVCGRFYVDPLVYYGEALRTALPWMLPHWRSLVSDPRKLDALVQS
jgi:hypothetical protein